MAAPTDWDKRSIEWGSLLGDIIDQGSPGNHKINLGAQLCAISSRGEKGSAGRAWPSPGVQDTTLMGPENVHEY